MSAGISERQARRYTGFPRARASVIARAARRAGSGFTRRRFCAHGGATGGCSWPLGAITWQVVTENMRLTVVNQVNPLSDLREAQTGLCSSVSSQRYQPREESRVHLQA